MAITDTLVALEKAVENAKAKQLAADNASAAAMKAQQEFSASLAEVERLKTEVMSSIGNIFPSGASVRQF